MNEGIPIEFAEIWLLNREDDVNKLLKVGWKFIQIVYEEKELEQAGWFFVKTIGTQRITKYLMGRSKGIAPRLESGYESVDDYVKKVKKKD